MKQKNVLAYLAISILTVSLFSCKKDDPKPVEKSPLEILTSHVWQIDEIGFLQQNTEYYYKRGASSGNTANFDIEYIKFNADKTGERSDHNEIFPLTWDFVNGDESRIQIISQEGKPLTINWVNVTYKENVIKYSEYYNRNGTRSFAAGTRVPKP